ncbi:IDEAL domain-containing protein [Paucisalibacillus globulus]|uniref:IDEAL domain-containing protein n=1 Tax=Paucisalibacillus globulus TaxID=351095 RepID=UPI000BB79BEF|nr:IDEAL domain-containing protein [Paucisalibacillus globulus]
MKKEKVSYRFYPYDGKVLNARRELSFEIRLTSRLILDEICFNWNKKMLEERIDRSIQKGNKEEFASVRKEYLQYIWE